MLLRVERCDLGGGHGRRAARCVRARREGAEGGLERVEFFNCCVTSSVEKEKEFFDIGVDLVIE